jgi:catechol 2,3-dioxygenase-like lactoylglutathione lyase family enzyme
VPVPILRVARPSDDPDALLPFYRDGLGMTVLYRFQDHDGFDGIMLGQAGAPYHLEFTSKRGHRVGRAPTPDNLLVLYYPDREHWRAAVQRMRDAGFAPVRSFNPYWDKDGATFEDPDGYRVVLQSAAWTL